MFVFPAFDNGYKKRRRTFVCCSHCRSKKIKCKLHDNFEKNGCEGCTKSNLDCDLISAAAETSSTDDNVNIMDNPTPTVNSVTSVESPHVSPSVDSVASGAEQETRQEKFDPPIVEELNNMPDYAQRHGYTPKVINSAVARSNYLKIKFNYNVLSELEHFLFPNSSEQRYISNNDTLMNGYSLKYIESICGFYFSYIQFSKEDMRSLFQLYFNKYNSVFPIIHERTFWEDYENDANPTILLHTLMYFINKDTLARPLMVKYFGEADTDEELTKFRAKLSMQIRHILVTMPILNPSTKMIVYLLLSLDNTVDKSVKYKRTSKEDFALAVNNAIALGLHLQDDNLSTEVSSYQADLIWTIYALGIFNVIAYGDCSNMRFIQIRFNEIDRKISTNPNVAALIGVARPIEDLMTKNFPSNDVSLFKHLEHHICNSRFEDSTPKANFEQYNPEHPKTIIGLLHRVANYMVILKYNKSLESPDEMLSLSYSRVISNCFLELGDHKLLQIPLFMEALGIGIKMLSTVAIHNEDIKEYEHYITPYYKYWDVLSETCKDIQELKNL